MRADAAVSIADKVRFLERPSSYPRPPDAVEVEETHMSWVFLAGDDVYKLKKPVKYPFLDFSTLEAREADCRDEVRLNRRLAPDVYLGVRALTRADSGDLAIEGGGEVVDWLVHMRRLPADRMLDAVIEGGGPTKAEVDAVGAVLTGFYAGLPPADLAPDAYVARLREEHAKNLAVLEQRAFAVDGARLDALADAVAGFLDRDGALLRARVRGGRVVEGHGDLRPEHVCLVEPPVVIDCLEFNRNLRLVDPVEELAYLTLECDRLGAAWVGERLQVLVQEGLGDRPDPRLVEFHTAFRACLRARLALAHLLEPEPRLPERWPRMARAYLDIADRAARRLNARAGP
jgi:aminoglycoside phosphotransferase family enzyme